MLLLVVVFLNRSCWRFVRIEWWYGWGEASCCCRRLAPALLPLFLLLLTKWWWNANEDEDGLQLRVVRGTNVAANRYGTSFTLIWSYAMRYFSRHLSLYGTLSHKLWIRRRQITNILSTIFNRSINQPDDMAPYWTSFASNSDNDAMFRAVGSIWVIWSCLRRADLTKILWAASRRNWGLDEWIGGGGQQGTRQYRPQRNESSASTARHRLG